MPCRRPLGRVTRPPSRWDDSTQLNWCYNGRMTGWIILIPVFCAVIWLVAASISKRSNNPLVKKRMNRIQWAMVIVGIVAFMAYEGHHPGRDGSDVPFG